MLYYLENNTSEPYASLLESLKQKDSDGFSFSESYLMKHLEELIVEMQEHMDDRSSYLALESLCFEQLIRLSKPSKSQIKKVSELVKARQSVKTEGSKIITVENPACVTPHISELAKGLFNEHIVIVNMKNIAANLGIEIVCDNGISVKIAKDEPESSWVGNAVIKKGIYYYTALKLDDFVLECNSDVYFNTDKNICIGRVMYMFEKHSKKYLHIQEYCFGKDTILEETAGEQDLFLTDKCTKIEGKQVINIASIVYSNGNTKMLDSSSLNCRCEISSNF